MDINRASAEELKRAFEVDGERARYIIEKRNELGGFENWEQIKEIVPSIEDKMVDNLRAAGITIGPRNVRRVEVDGWVQNRTSESSKHEERHLDSQRHKSKSVNSVSREELEEVCQIDGDRADYFLQNGANSVDSRAGSRLRTKCRALTPA
jgi:hypothetical protein